MKMKNILILMCTMMLCASCTPLKMIEEEAMTNYNDRKDFNVSDFKVYVFNICEKYADDVESTERFCECPPNFFDVAVAQKIRKVEELYMLIHRKTNLVLYFTTTSHKYIYKTADGFLNDPTKYKNNIVLNEIENIYIGRQDTSEAYMHFPSYQDVNDIILHYDKSKLPNQLFLTSANLATAENDYDISEEISLDNVFNQELAYNYNEAMTMTYYKTESRRSKGETALTLNRIAITSKKGNVGVLLGFDGDDNLYQFAKMKVKYHPNYSLIQTH